MLSLEFANPARGAFGLVVIKQLGVQNPIQWNLASRGRNDFSPRVECVDDGFDFTGLFLRNQVKLVQDDDVGEFDLIDKQIRDGAVVLLAKGFTPGLKRLCFVVIVQETVRINNRDHRVET